MGRWRRAATALVCVAALVGVPTTPATAAVEGFSTVRTGTAQRNSITAVAPGDVWVAGRASNGRVRLEHFTGGQWWTAQLPVQADESLAVHGTAKKDVWLVSSGQLWRYQGSWRKVALPASRQATAVFDVKGKDVYVGTKRAATGDAGPDVIAELYRFNGRSWTRLGGPELPDQWRTSGVKTITRIMVTGGRVSAEVTWRPPAAVEIWQVFSVSGAQWTEIARTGQRSGNSLVRLPGWISYASGTQLFVGYGEGGSGPVTSECLRVVAGTTESCSSASAATAAVLPRGGPAVLGGRDWQRVEDGAFVDVPGRFLARRADGTERTLAGDPGDRTIALAADPTGATVWALTIEGERYAIQRYRR